MFVKTCFDFWIFFIFASILALPISLTSLRLATALQSQCDRTAATSDRATLPQDFYPGCSLFNTVMMNIYHVYSQNL